MKRQSVFAAVLFIRLAAAGMIFIPSFAAAQNLDQQADQFNDQGRFAEAEALYKRSLANKEKSLGPNNPEVARSLNNLGAFYYAQGRYPEAEDLLKRGLTIREKVLGPNHSDVGNSLNNLAALYDEQGRYADAEPLYRRSIAIAEKKFGPNHSEVASALNNLGVLYYKQGRYAEAEVRLKRGLAIREKVHGPNHSDVGNSLNNLAALYDEQGHYADAEPMYRRSITVTEKAFGPNHSLVASALNNLGALYSKQGRYADTEPLYKRSLAITEKVFGANHPEVAPPLNNLASLYDDLGRYAEAETLYKRSLAIKEKSLGAHHTDVASSLNNLALVYYNQDRYADAEPLYKRSLAINEKALGPNHPEVAPSLNNLAVLYDKQRRHADAEPLYKRALALKEKAFGPDHPDVANHLNNLAKLYNNQQRYADALPILKRMIASRQARKSVFPIILGAEKAKFINKSQSFAESYDVLQFTSSSAAAEAVNRLAQRYAAGTGELATLVRSDQDLGTEIDKLDQAILAAVSKAPKERNQAAEDDLLKRIAAIKTQREKIQSSLSLKFPDYVALSNPQPISVQDTQKLLDDDEAVIAFDIGNENSYVWVVTRTTSFWTEIPTKSKTLDDQVRDLRQSITQSVDDSYDTALAYTIYQGSFGPIAAMIAGKKRLSIVANGALTSLPFGLLVTSQPSGKSLKDADWLIKTHAITIIPSIYSLKTMRTQAGVSNAPKAMLAFADPVFSRSERTKAKSKQASLRSLPSLYRGTQIDIKALAETLPQLAGTRKEVETIGKTLSVDPADIKFGLSATETAVKQSNLDQYRILYFATHGLVSGDIAAFSKAKTEPALALAIPDKPNELDDGLLQASEVAQLKLNADWVVLSACNTASGGAVGAEALSGLARAFLYAGGRSLVVSHWEVDDEATAALMSNLFEISTKNPTLSHGQALQQAMLKQLDKAKTNVESHPRMWAPFVVVGEPKRRN